jgi:hypothetical protein
MDPFEVSRWSRLSVRAVAFAMAASVLVACGNDDDDDDQTGDTGIVRIEVASTEPLYEGEQFGTVGDYEVVTGRAYGRVDPGAALNAVIRNIEKTPTNADGLIEYSVDFKVFRPVDASKGNGRLWFEAPNRGTIQTFGRINSGSLTEPGTGFLLKEGYTIVAAGWQAELAKDEESSALKPQFPLVMAGDAPEAGLSREQFIPDTPQTGGSQTVENGVLRSELTYPPVSEDIVQAKVVLYVRQNADDPRVQLPSSNVTLGPGRQVQIKLSEDYDEGAIYDLVYEATEQYVSGLGFVAIRDLASFFRNATSDVEGNVNPARSSGRSFDTAFGYGNSQTGRFMRHFLYLGMNQDLQGNQVFDGLLPFVAGARMTSANHDFSQAGRWIRQHEESDFRGAQFPFAYATTTDPLSGRTDGVMARCAESDTCPKVIHTDTDTEVWQGRESLLFTDTRGSDLVQPDDVRIYLMGGAQHGPGNGVSSSTNRICKFANNSLDQRPYYRALVKALEAWVDSNVEPPAPNMPSVAGGTLLDVEAAAQTYPVIPGAPFNRRINGVNLADDDAVPPTQGTSYPVFTTRFDAAGNPVGGVTPVDIRVPTGTHSGRNYRAPGHAEDELCAGNGSFIPLPRTEAEKASTGDARPSLEALYPGGIADYRAQRRAAAQQLLENRLLLAEDLEAVVEQGNWPQAQ